MFQTTNRSETQPARAERSLQRGVLHHGAAGQRAAEEQRVRALLAAAARIQRGGRGRSKRLQQSNQPH